jgi:excisionase family DNA binding protein
VAATRVLAAGRLDGPGQTARHIGAAMAIEHVAEPVDLAALVEDPTRVATVPHGRIPALLSQLSALQSAMAARLISADRDEPMSGEDTLLTVAQAAERLGVSTDWLFRRSRTLPFVVRLGRHLRFSNRGIDRYLRNRTGR